MLRSKEDTLAQRSKEIEELDKKVLDLERNYESLDIKKNSIERAAQTQKKQLDDQIAALKESLETEKVQRETWIEKYEKEQAEHTTTSTQLMQARSDLKDEVMEKKNIEIQYQMT